MYSAATEACLCRGFMPTWIFPGGGYEMLAVNVLCCDLCMNDCCRVVLWLNVRQWMWLLASLVVYRESCLYVPLISCLYVPLIRVL